jgi:rod shape-determining protein MreD
MTLQRALSFFLVTYLALAVVSSLAALLPWHVPAPEIPLLIVLYVGLRGRGSMASHAALALGVGYLADLFAGSPRGLHSLTLGLLMLVARGASSRLMVASLWQLVVVTLVATVGHGALLVALISSMYGDDAGRSALRLAPLTALSTAVAAPLAFALLRRIDQRLSPDPRALRMSA